MCEIIAHANYNGEARECSRNVWLNPKAWLVQESFEVPISRASNVLNEGEFLKMSDWTLHDQGIWVTYRNALPFAWSSIEIGSIPFKNMRMGRRVGAWPFGSWVLSSDFGSVLSILRSSTFPSSVGRVQVSPFPFTYLFLDRSSAGVGPYGLNPVLVWPQSTVAYVWRRPRCWPGWRQRGLDPRG